MNQFDQFANQGGPDQTPEETAEALRVAEEQLKNADYSGDLPEPLGHGRHAADSLGDFGDDDAPAPDDAADPAHRAD